jgi:hypothetical protein
MSSISPENEAFGPNRPIESGGLGASKKCRTLAGCLIFVKTICNLLARRCDKGHCDE